MFSAEELATAKPLRFGLCGERKEASVASVWQHHNTVIQLAAMVGSLRSFSGVPVS